jgi:hypothetical protein
MQSSGFSRSKTSSFLFLLIFLLQFGRADCYGQTSSSTPEDKRASLFSLKKITPDGKLIVRRYDVNSTSEIDASDLEIWHDQVDKEDPLRIFYWQPQPDWKLELLNRGYARLKDEGKAPANYLEAQALAKKSGLGLWASQQPASKPSPTAESPTGLGDIAYVLLWVVIAVTGWFGGSACIQLVLAWWRRHQVPLILVGRPSTGKSWLCNRLIYPDIATSDLQRIKRTEVSLKEKPRLKKPLGRYEVTPVYVDTPGGKAGDQVNRLIEEKGFFKWLRRVFIRTKSVWLIMLATTPETNVHEGSPEDRKVDLAYIEQQLGHLDLPVGMLSSERTPKPQMVITCIGKFDLFSSRDPNDSSSEAAKNKLRSIFLRHINRVEKECKDQGIPFQLVMCSALKGWGTNEIWRYVEKAVFN